MENREEIVNLADLALLAGGQVDGDPGVFITGVCSLDHPRHGCIALAVDNAKIAWGPGQDEPSALIVSKRPAGIDLPLLVHPNPRLAFTIALRHLYPVPELPEGISPLATIHDDADVDASVRIAPFTMIEAGTKVGPGVQIWPGCYVGRNSEIGEGTKIYPNVVVMHDVTIGRNCILQPGVVIGSDGFGYTPTEKGNMKVPQIGRVIIGDEVEIGANTTIDRATLDATIIADDVKIDNLVQLAHNVKVGRHTRIAAQAGLSGRVQIEDNVVIAGQAGFQNGITVGEGSVIAGRAGVIGDVPANSRMSGMPARDHRKALRIIALQNRLPEILDRLEKIEKRIADKTIES
jgi:UDP-3-O-[3-hydroxymyristoyl] glucosamine N-acyltransferase